MATSNVLNTNTVNLNEIFGNGKVYFVPTYQRDYSWEEENWEDLWTDILIANDQSQPHYMGAIVLQNKGEKSFWIIDGQQRFTTLSILAIAFIRFLKQLVDKGVNAEENKERIEILVRQFLGQKDPASLRYSSKLYLNENNDAFYQQRLLNFNPPINYNKLSDSEKLLWDAFNYFKGKLESYFSSTQEGEKIAGFLSKHIAENLLFIQITVQDELNAYTVFETLNSRGVELTSTDLLKNFLFSVVAKSKTDLDHVKGQWKKIIDIVGLREFPTYLRHFLNSRSPLVTKENLFKRVKAMVQKPPDVFDLLNYLETYAYIYVALGNPNDEFWIGNKDIIDSVRQLKLFRITQAKPLLMGVYDKLLEDQFTRVLKDIVSISFRYNVIGKLNANEMEKVYNRAAMTVFNGKATTASAVFFEIKGLYVEDEDFKNDFKTRSFNTRSQRKLVRYILYSIEGQLEGGNKYDYELDSGTIEHILPENGGSSWMENFNETDYPRFVYMIGNLTLLEPKINKAIGVEPFEHKKSFYDQSKFQLTNKITEYAEWTPTAVRHRQAQLARIATAVWKVNY